MMLIFVLMTLIMIQMVMDYAVVIKMRVALMSKKVLMIPVLITLVMTL